SLLWFPVTLPLVHPFCSLVFGLPHSGVILHRGQMERMKDEGRIKKLRSLRSLQDGDENRGQLFALLSQRCELFHADNPRFHEQFQPVGAFFNLAQRIAAFRDELIRSLPTRSPLPSRLYRLCRITPEGHHGVASKNV